VSSFAVGATTVTIQEQSDGFQEQYPTLLRTWEFDALLTLTTDYTTLVTLVTYPITVRACPGPAGVTMITDYGGGAGPGTLTLDNVVGSPFSAMLIRISRPSAYPGGARKVHLSFQEAAA
jgi:hypothetical protein